MFRYAQYANGSNNLLTLNMQRQYTVQNGNANISRGGVLEAISNQVKVYIVMQFFCAECAFKYLGHTQFFWRQQYAN